MSKSYSLFELHSYVKQVFALNFGDAVWIHAEISQSNEVRGQVYMDLIEKSENSDEILAQGNAIIQYKNLLFLKKKLGKTLASILTQGTEIKVKVKLEFHERYGYKLMIEDLDATYTIGQAALKRQEIIDRLEQDGLLHLNEGLPMPGIVQRLAVISSSTAAGYKDFEQHLLNNDYGYQFKLDLYQTSMQGKNTAPELVHSINRINKRKEDYDCIIIIRGGGAKLDLASFDHYNIGYAIATATLPVICGIGHEIDNTVADLAAHTSVKTPTAVAEYAINSCVKYESSILQLGKQIQYQIKDTLHLHNINLINIGQSIQYIPKERIQDQLHKLNRLERELKSNSLSKLDSHNQALSHYEQIISLTDPINVLRKGYVMTKQKGKVINSVKDINPAAEITLQYHDGKQIVTVS